MIPVAPKNHQIKASEAFGEHHPWFESFAISLNQNDPDMLRSVFDDYENTFAQYDVEKLFPLIKCPVLILRGGIDKGSLITDDDIRLALQLLLNAQETKIPHVGHALFMEDKDAVANVILEFTKNLEK
jgi:pimeloyl-ACP methyl ester carboxylesterase